MRNGNFLEFFPMDLIAQFFVEANGCFTGVHGEAVVPPVAGYVFGETHQNPANALALQNGANGHLA